MSLISDTTLPFLDKKTDLDSFLSSKTHPLCIIIVSPECPHCQDMMPAVRSVRTALDDASVPEPVGAVVDITTARASDHPVLSSVRSVPTIVSVDEEATTEFDGMRNPSSILTFMKESIEDCLATDPSKRSSTRSSTRSSKRSSTRSSKRSTRRSTRRSGKASTRRSTKRSHA